CMLLDAGLDNRFWREAILTATYLQNRMINRSVNKTPVELFTGEKPDVNHIRIFGSKVYSFIPKQRRKKWDDKAEEGVLVGYDGNSKGYRILDPSTNKIWISRSVRIVENETKMLSNEEGRQGNEVETTYHGDQEAASEDEARVDSEGHAPDDG
ncbi:Copia protein, partial [Cyphomyrmex costatus]